MNQKKKKPQPNTFSLEEFNLLADLESQEKQLRRGETKDDRNPDGLSASLNPAAASFVPISPLLGDTTLTPLERREPRSSDTTETYQPSRGEVDRKMSEGDSDVYTTMKALI